MKTKTIRIYPSIWEMDIVIGGTKKQLETYSEQRYGLKEDPITHNECITITSSKESELKGKTQFCICLKSLKDKGILVHEIVHLIWHIGESIGYKIVYDSQEWQAVLFEYIYNEILNHEGYEIYK